MYRRLKVLWRRLAFKFRKAILLGSNQRRKSDGPPIFIMGAPRSGTTLVRMVLNSHSRIACPGETWFLVSLFSQLHFPLIRMGLASMGVGREEAVSNIRELALHYYERYLHQRGKARWADKTPGYTLLAPEIYEVFGPDVRFIHVVRHGLDVADSFQGMRRFMEETTAYTDLGRIYVAAWMWIAHCKAFREFQEAHPEVCHTVRYEDLTERPEQTVKEILDFLGEEWEPEMLDYRGFVHEGAGDLKAMWTHSEIVPNSGKYLSWDEERRRKTEEFVREELLQQGYEMKDLLLPSDADES